MYYRITKYNPQYRNKNGKYLEEEWTSYSDISKCFSDQLLTFEEYISVENKYIQAVLELATSKNISKFKLVELEKYDEIELDNNSTENMISLYPRC